MRADATFPFPTKASTGLRLAMGLIPLSLCLILPACGRVTEAVATNAEATRDATEKASISEEEEDQRRAEEIKRIGQRAREKNAVLLGERYILRPSAQGWAVVDLSNGRPISVAGAPMTDLNLKAAQSALDNLYADQQRRNRMVTPR